MSVIVVGFYISMINKDVNEIAIGYKVEDRKIRGDADIILFPNIHSANIAYNLMLHVIQAKSGTLFDSARSKGYTGARR